MQNLDESFDKMALTAQELEEKQRIWKKTAKEIPVSLQSEIYTDRISTGIVYYKEWQVKEKARRALKAFGLMWGLAILSVAIPIAHFVLVPVFFLAGPIAALIIFSRESAILGGVGTCPDCNEIFDISKSKPQKSMKDVCSCCHHQIFVIHNTNEINFDK